MSHNCFMRTADTLSLWRIAEHLGLHAPLSQVQSIFLVDRMTVIVTEAKSMFLLISSLDNNDFDVCLGLQAANKYFVHHTEICENLLPAF